MITSTILLSYLVAAGADDPVGTATTLASGSPLFGPLTAVAAIVVTCYLLARKIASIRQDGLKEATTQLALEKAENKRVQDEQNAEIAALRTELAEAKRALSTQMKQQAEETTKAMAEIYESQRQAEKRHQEEIKRLRDEHTAEDDVTRVVYEKDLEEERARTRAAQADTRKAQDEAIYERTVVYRLREYITKNGLEPPCFD